MSIQGYIEKVQMDDTRPCLHIELCGWTDKDGTYSPPGQRYLRIMFPTWTPEVGMVIWGGSGEVLIGSQERRYRRWGYTKIFEAGIGLEERFRPLGWAGV